MVRKIQGKIKGLKTDQFGKKPVIMDKENQPEETKDPEKPEETKDPEKPEETKDPEKPEETS